MSVSGHAKLGERFGLLRELAVEPESGQMEKLFLLLLQRLPLAQENLHWHRIALCSALSAASFAQGVHLKWSSPPLMYAAQWSSPPLMLPQCKVQQTRASILGMETMETPGVVNLRKVQKSMSHPRTRTAEVGSELAVREEDLQCLEIFRDWKLKKVLLRWQAQQGCQGAFVGLKNQQRHQALRRLRRHLLHAAHLQCVLKKHCQERKKNAVVHLHRLELLLAALLQGVHRL